jgi:hypothetical protein
MPSPLIPRLLALLVALPLAAIAQSTTITLTDKVLVKDTEGLGAHFGGDTFYDSVILKRRVAENFEGSVNRLHVMGGEVQPEADGMYVFGINRDLEPEIYLGASARVLSGPDFWTEVKIVGIETRVNPGPRDKGKDTTFVKIDRPIRWSTDWMNGLLVDARTEGRGQHPWIVEKRSRVDGVPKLERIPDPQYTSIGNVNAITGDTPPLVGQQASLSLDGSKDAAWVRFRVQFYRAAPFDGTWTVKLWTRARSGQPELAVGPTVPGKGDKLKPGAEWQEHTVKLDLSKPPEGQNPIFMIELRATGGDVLVDNVQAWKDGDSTNPTPFRDGLVETMRFIDGGSIRYLRNTRDSYINSVLPAIANSAQRSVGTRKDNFGAHEFYELCAHLGANPWSTLPGTFMLEEVDQMMEYHAAPADVGLGKLRAQLGQEKPWTEVFDTIHLQFGNEAITFFGTGYYGPDYWKALVARIKASPYYDPNKFVLHLNEQGGGLKRLFGYHPGFDRGTINGYHIFGVYEDQVKRAGDIPGFYDWVYASVWHMWMVEQNNRNWNNLVATRDLGKEISIYEGGNYHSTFSDPENAPMERINKMLAGRAGGVSAVNSMLVLLKHWGARTQQNFNFSQETFSPGGSFGNLPERIRGWGGVIGMGGERQRFRPRFLALAAANRVIGGDLVETVHTGADPKFTVTNRFGAGYGPSRNPVEMAVADVARIHSYGFAEGDRRGLILVSNDPRQAQPVEIKFEGEVQGGKARVWMVDSPEIEDTNEFDWSPAGPSVKLVEREIEFRSGQQIQLPPATLMSIDWTVRK